MPLKVPGSGRMLAPPLAGDGGDSIHELVNQDQYGIREWVDVITVVGYGCDSLRMTRHTEFTETDKSPKLMAHRPTNPQN